MSLDCFDVPLFEHFHIGFSSVYMTNAFTPIEYCPMTA